MGNICRSPAAEGCLQHLVNQGGFSTRILVDSAGTIDDHKGHRADARMRSTARSRGYRLRSRARQITRNDLEEFDLVVAMDGENFEYIKRLHSSPRAEVRMLSHFLTGNEWPADVPDPYYGGRKGFEAVLDMIEEACPNILEFLLSPDNRLKNNA